VGAFYVLETDCGRPRGRFFCAAETSTVKPADAADHVDEEVVIEFEVQSAHFLQDKNIGFLNSERNNGDAKTLRLSSH
jgi:hypothetical protein